MNKSKNKVLNCCKAAMDRVNNKEIDILKI